MTPRRLRIWGLALLILAVLIPVYLLTYNGAFRADDEHILAARGQSLALWGRLDDPQVFGNERVRGLIPQGDAATQIEPGLSILGAAAYRLGAAAGVGGMQAAFMLDLYLTAATALIVYACVLVLGYRTEAALWCALLFGLGSMAWPYATAFYRDTLAMFMVSLAFLGWAVLLAHRGRWRGLALIAFGILGGTLTKNTVAALAPVLGLPVAYVFIMEALTEGRLNRLAVLIGAFTLLMLGLAALPAGGTLARFSPGYYAFLARIFLRRLTPAALPGLLGPFLSPAKSVFLFSPPLLLSIFGLSRLDRPRWLFAAPAVAYTIVLALAQSLFYVDEWAGGFGWGLRGMLPAFPALFVLSAPAVESLLENERFPGRLALGAVLLAGASVQLAATLVPWRDAYLQWRAQGLDPADAGAAWDVRFLALPIQFSRLARPAAWDTAWIRLAQSGSGAAAGLLAGCVLFAGAAGGLILNTRSRVEGLFGPLALAAAAILLPLYPSLALLKGDPALAGDRAELAQAVAWAEARVEEGDTVVVDSYATPLWALMMNQWTAPAAWTSTPFELPPDANYVAWTAAPSEATLELLQSLSEGGGRLWLIASSDAPDFAARREAAWLEEHASLEAKQTFEGTGSVEVWVFRLER